MQHFLGTTFSEQHVMKNTCLPLFAKLACGGGSGYQSKSTVHTSSTMSPNNQANSKEKAQ